MKSLSFQHPYLKYGWVYGVILLLFLLSFFFTPTTLDPILPIRFLIFSLGIGLLSLFLWISSKQEDHLPNSPNFNLFWALLLVFILWQGINLPFHLQVMEGIHSLMHLLLGFCWFVLLWIGFSSQKIPFSLLALALTLIALLQALIGILQFYGLAFGQVPPVSTDLPFGTMGNRNLFASALVLMFPFCLYSAFSQHPYTRYIGILATGSTLVGILLSQTRAAWLALVGAVVLGLFCAILHPQVHTQKILKKSFSLLGIGIVLIVLILAVTPSLRQNVQHKVQEIGVLQNSPNSVQERLAVWHSSLSLWKESPIAGIGAGNWNLQIPRKKIPTSRAEKGEAVYVRAHNDYLQFLAETGLVGLLCYLGIWGIIFRKAWKNIFTPSQKKRPWLPILIFCGLTAFFIDAFFSFPHERVFHLAVCMIFWAKTLQTQPSQSNKISLGKWCIALFIISALGFGLAQERFRSLQNAKAATAANAQGNYTEGLELIKKANSPWIEMDEALNPYLLTQGYSFIGLKQMEKAQASFERGLQVHPYHIALLFNLGQLYAKDSRSKSKMYYQKVLEIAPKHSPSLKALGVMYARERDFSKAYQYLVQADTSGDKQLQALLQALQNQNR